MEQYPQCFRLPSKTSIKGKSGNAGKGKSIPMQALTGLWGFQEIGAPRFQDNQHLKVVRLSALHTGCLCPQDSVDPRAIVQLEGLSVKNSSDTIRNRTSDLPACSTVKKGQKWVSQSMSLFTKMCGEQQCIITYNRWNLFNTDTHGKNKTSHKTSILE